jgi:hypothetical protein
MTNVAARTVTHGATWQAALAATTEIAIVPTAGPREVLALGSHLYNDV